MFINIYEITRHFGRYEESGWWYHWLKCIETKEVSEDTKDDVMNELELKYNEFVIGNIYSMDGGIVYGI